MATHDKQKAKKFKLNLREGKSLENEFYKRKYSNERF